jgi:hypothetical protein
LFERLTRAVDVRSTIGTTIYIPVSNDTTDDTIVNLNLPFEANEEAYITMEDNTLFENVLIFTGDSFTERGYVLVEHGKIAEVGHGAPAMQQTGLKRVNGSSHTLIPGLIDSHVHGLYGNERTIEESLRFGVTTVCDMHNEPQHIKKLRDVSNFLRATRCSDRADDYKLANSEKSLYADFKAAGTGATVKGGCRCRDTRHDRCRYQC